MSRPEAPGHSTTLIADDIEGTLQRLAGDEVHLAVATGALPSGECRTHEFRLGRAALGRVLTQMGEETEPERVRFPHPALSISHSGGTAVAVGLRRAKPNGVGIDLEFPRPFDPRAAKFFLNVRETWPDIDVLHQLWTVKEAVFKADLDNAGRLLHDYEVTEFEQSGIVSAGRARRGRLGFTFRSFLLDGLMFSIAQPESSRS